MWQCVHWWRWASLGYSTSINVPPTHTHPSLRLQSFLPVWTDTKNFQMTLLLSPIITLSTEELHFREKKKNSYRKLQKTDNERSSLPSEHLGPYTPTYLRKIYFKKLAFYCVLNQILLYVWIITCALWVRIKAIHFGWSPVYLCAVTL